MQRIHPRVSLSTSENSIIVCRYVSLMGRMDGWRLMMDRGVGMVKAKVAIKVT